MEQPRKEPVYANPYLAGIGLGIVLFLSFVLTGHGLGASGGLARIMTKFVDIIAPEHVDRMVYFASKAGGTRNPFGHWILLLLIGVALGGMASAFISKRLRPQIHKGPHAGNVVRLITAVLGGILVGYGAGLARGCTSGQGLSGAVVLAVGSWAFLFAVFAGGFLLAYPIRKLWN
ncbi:MAG TPA: hypothetical protein ENJ06_04360 [Phycisphaeraceae bacterium]|nr:hypothetical protein [Phycisphaeraceae bacterium]